MQHITLVRTATLLLFEQLIHLNYFTLVFGGELVGGEVVSWWQNSPVER